MIREFFSIDYFVFSFDLKSGFITWIFSHQHRKYLAFSWDFDGNQTYLIFNLLFYCLVFPVRAPFIFTKLFKPLQTF